MKQVQIHSDFITLGQLLKLTDCISTGGETKHFLENTKVEVNGDKEQRRGKKLYNGDRVEIDQFGVFVIVGPNDAN